MNEATKNKVAKNTESKVEVAAPVAKVTKAPMFEIKVTALREAIVTDMNSNKEYKVKVEPYHRVDKTGNRIVCRQVRVDGIPGATTRSGVVQIPRQVDKESGKLLLKVTFQSDLSGKKTSSTEFNEMFI